MADRPDLRAGDWIQFDEEFRYGDAATANYIQRQLVDDRHDLGADHALSGLVYFAATDELMPPFVLIGSSVHVLDRWQSRDSPDKQVGRFYMDALLAYARQLAKLPDEAAATEFAPPSGFLHPALRDALLLLCRVSPTMEHSGWVTEPVQLTGHARVLAVEPAETEVPPSVLATPLYVEYAHRG